MLACPAGNSTEISNKMSDTKSKVCDYKEEQILDDDDDDDGPQSTVIADAETTQFLPDAKNSDSEKEDPVPHPEEQEVYQAQQLVSQVKL